MSTHKQTARTPIIWKSYEDYRIGPQRGDRCTEKHPSCIHGLISRELQCAKKVMDAGHHWTCTQVKGHKGPHVACNSTQHNLCIWDD